MAPNTSTKYDLEKFDGSNDFSLWRMKIRAVLIQQGLLKALNRKQRFLDTMSADEKEDIKDYPECKGKQKDNSKKANAGVVEDNSDGASNTIIGAAATVSSSDVDSDTTKLRHMLVGHMSERGYTKIGNSQKSKNDSSVEITSWENKKKKGSRKKHSIKTSIEAIICSDNDSSGDEGGHFDDRDANLCFMAQKDYED
ncbi:hypothetical protein RJ639_038087 [Escallonia herrerae]|uniref:Uncharacterized protein n=1 Tax=Escallonia herrerae TaxID=1293975 RepID=A0AA88WME0_9ASTE|nr:hypothetical protein RJ639_038087 [Escallonia herrerae]